MVRLLMPLLMLPLFFFSATGWSQSQEEDIPQAQVSQNNDALTIQVGKAVYAIEAPSNQQKANFDTLSDDEQKSFRHKRALLLSTLARPLQALKYGFGAGAFVKDHLSYYLETRREEKMLKEILQRDARLVDDMGIDAQKVRDARLKKAGETAQMDFKERSNQVISGVLQGIDRALWAQANLFAHSNEFSCMSAAALQIESGVDEKGRGGLFEIGFSFGFNVDTRSVVFQIFRNVEKFQSTTMKAIFVAGLVGKAGFYVANQKKGVLEYKGTSFYPPVAPLFSSTTPESFTTGFSSGLTFPPSPLADILTYTNSADKKVLLRISISPLLKGFVRVETGLNRRTLTFFLQPVLKAFETVHRRIFGAPGPMLCSKVLSAS